MDRNESEPKRTPKKRPKASKAKNLRDGQRSKNRLRKLYEEERINGYCAKLSKIREQSKIRTANNRRQKRQLGSQIYEGPGALPGETYQEHESRLRRDRRIRKKKGAEQNGDKSDKTNNPDQEDFSKKAASSFQDKIKKRIEFSIKTVTERQYNAILRPQSNSKKARPKNYLELDAQIAEEWSFKEFLVQDLSWKFDKVRKELVVEALEIEVGPDIPSLEKDKTVYEVGDETQELTEAQNRWSGFFVNKSAIVDHNGIQIKIEQEDVEDDDEEGVEDWIAQVMANSDGEDDEDPVSKSSTPCEIKEVSVSKIKPKQSRRSQLLNCKMDYMEKLKLDRLKKLQEQLKSLRDRWIAEKPEEDDVRAKVDEERNKFQTFVLAEKQTLIEDIRLELSKKREKFSVENKEERELRIRLAYQKEISFLKLPTVAKHNATKGIKSTVLTKEQQKAMNADNAIKRLRKEKQEYIFYKALVAVIPSSEVRKEEIENFEKILAQKENREVIDFWNNYKSNSDIRILAYRKMLFNLLSTRLRMEEQSTIPSELVLVPESQSLKDIAQVKEFLAVNGKTVDEHVTFKRFYPNVSQRRRNARINSTLTREEIEKNRVEMNARYRQYYHKKKFGLDTELGDYLKPRDPKARNNKLDQLETKSKNEAQLAPPQRKRASATKTSQRKRKSQKVEDSGSEESLKEVPDPTDSYSTYNNNEFSNSGDGFTDCGADDGSNEMWTPSGSVEVEPISHELINFATGIGGINSPYYQQNQQLSFQNQGLIGTHGFQQLNPQYGEQYFNQMPQTIVNQNQQWMGHLPNNQLNILAHISSNQQQQIPQRGNNAPSSSTNATLETSQTIPPQPNVNSEIGDNDGYSSSSSSSIHSPPKKSRGRPKGFKVSRSKNRNIALSQNLLQKAKRRDIWNNRKRRKYYDILAEEVANSTAVDSIVATPAITIFQDAFEKAREELSKLNSPELESSPNAPIPQIPKVKVDLNYQCKSCLTSLSGPFKLIQHIFLKHYEAKRYLCPFSFSRKCFNSKFDKYGLNCHVIKYHPKEVNTSWIIGVNSRKRISDAKKFLCLRCEGVFDCQNELFDHYKSTHGKIRYECTHCGIYLREEDFFEDHIKFFHSEKKHGPPQPLEIDENDMHRCKTCFSEFSSESFLNDHISQGHSWLKNKDSELKEAETVELPLELQIPENSYKCEICPRSYMHLFSCRRHAITEHQLIEVFETMKEKDKVSSQPNQCQSTNQILDSRDNRSSSSVDINDALKMLFTCPKCPFQATAKDFHHLHVSYDKVMKKYCAQCDRVFSRSIVLTQHREAAHGLLKDSWKNPPNIGKMGPIPQGVKPEDWHSCKVCSLGLTSEEVHACHLWSEKDSEVRNCPHCQKKFYNSDNYNNHLHMAHQVPLNMKMSIRKSTIVHNVEERELMPRDYDSLVAESSFKTATGEMNIYTCKICFKKNFKTKDFAVRHIENTHKEDAFTRLKCNECCCTFPTIKRLYRHQSEYHKDKLYIRVKCPFCLATYGRKDHLKAHVKSKHGGQIYSNDDVEIVPVPTTGKARIRCKICSKMFQEESLKSHMTNVHFPIDSSTFCDVCGVQINPKSLKSHLRTMHPESGLASKKRPVTSRLNLKEAVELIKEVYDQAGISYHQRINKPRKKKENSRKSKSKKSSGNRARKTTKKNEKEDSSDNEENLDESNNSSSDIENADIFYLNSSSSSEDEDSLLLSAINDDSSGDEEDGASFKDIFLKPSNTKKEPARKSVKSSIYTKNYEDDDKDTKEKLVEPNLKRKQVTRRKQMTAKNSKIKLDSEHREDNIPTPQAVGKPKQIPKRKRPTRKSTKPIYKDDYESDDELESDKNPRKSSSSQKKPHPAPESKKLVILLERCDDQVSKIIASKNCTINSRKKVPASSHHKSNKSPDPPPRTFTKDVHIASKEEAPSECDDEEIVIKEEIFEMKIEPEINLHLPPTEYNDIESELDTFILHNYGF